MINEQSRIPFGKRYKGRKLCECPEPYLRWIAENLRGGDFDEWANTAEKMLNDGTYSQSLEQKADDFLRSHGINPSKL